MNKKDKLKHTLQALALSSEEQLALFPTFAITADELALDFDNWFKANKRDLNDQEITILNRINSILENKSQEVEKSFWTDVALKTNDGWEQIRSLSKEALEIFNWPLEKPPVEKNEFIQ